MSIAVEVAKNAWPLERVKQAIRAARARGESLRNLGERPQRVVKALRPIPPNWLPSVDYEAARGFCNEAARLVRLEGAERLTDAEIRDRARLLWQREHPKEEPVWQVTPR